MPEWMANGVEKPFDLNLPVNCKEADDNVDPASFEASRKRSRPVRIDEEGNGATNARKQRPRGCEEVDIMMYKDNRLSKGGEVKEAGDVLRMLGDYARRRPNINCRVETFGKICDSFDALRKRWVGEMGFAGLLSLAGRQLPRSLCYWLMTRVDPENEMLYVGSRQFRLSVNQVRWVLGLPKGEQHVLTACTSQQMRLELSVLRMKYGQVWTYVDRRSGKVVRRTGFAITQEVHDKLVLPWNEEDGKEFKTLFLMAALDMVLCPTQCRRISSELDPALMCSGEARKYNWCALVLERLMASARRFARSFYKTGYASGCGGCTLFLAVLYLDRLARNPVMWGIRPRVKAWTTAEMQRACHEDRRHVKGDFGRLGVIDIAYGEIHPNEARDTDYCSENEDVTDPH